MDNSQRTPVTHPAHSRLAFVLVRLGLLGALGGSGSQLVVGEFVARGIDWGTISAFLIFGLLLAAIGECWTLDPTSHRDPSPR